jgi:hypothetical protein
VPPCAAWDDLRFRMMVIVILLLFVLAGALALAVLSLIERSF